MIRVSSISEGLWLVTVEKDTKTEHRVRVSEADLRRLGAGKSAEELLQASFRFLLEREPNTSIFPEFELPVISLYFPEYESEIGRYLAE